MLKSGVVCNESNDQAAAALDNMIEYMQTDDYAKKREKEIESSKPKAAPEYTYMARAEDVAGVADGDRRETVESTVDQDDDDELAALRAARLAKLKNKVDKEKEFKAKGHGMYREINEKEFLPEVTSTNCVVVHFFQESFTRCKLMHEKMGIVTNRQVQVKFLKINAQEAGFFVEKLQVRVLPCLVFFKDGVAVDKVVGFEGISDTETFPASALERKICQVFKLEMSSAGYDEDDE
eukprot:Hpha_TRINITY_DN16889_c3_g2::TRINITY_DN16889_c3_g2_i1::g.148284::m.148284